MHLTQHAGREPLEIRRVIPKSQRSHIILLKDSLPDQDSNSSVQMRPTTSLDIPSVFYHHPFSRLTEPRSTTLVHNRSVHLDELRKSH